MGNLNKSARNDNDNLFHSPFQEQLPGDGPPRGGRPGSRQPERGAKNAHVQALIGSMSNNRFFQNVVGTAGGQGEVLRGREVKEAVDFANFVMYEYASDKGNACVTLADVLLNEGFGASRQKFGVVERQGLLGKERGGQERVARVMRECGQRLRLEEMSYLLQDSQQPPAVRRKNKPKRHQISRVLDGKTSSRGQSTSFQQNIKESGKKGSLTANPSPSMTELLTATTSLPKQPLQLLQPAAKNLQHPKSPENKQVQPNSHQTKLNAEILARLHQKATGNSKAMAPDSATSIFAKTGSSKIEDKLKRTAAISVNEKQKSRILNDLKSLEAMQKRNLGPSVVKCDDLAAKKQAPVDSANSTCRQTAEFTVVPDATFSFQVSEPDSKFSSECSIRLNEQLGLEEAIRRASSKNQTRRDNFYKEQSRLSVIMEASGVHQEPPSPTTAQGPNRERRVKDRPAKSPDNLDERLSVNNAYKNKSFLEHLDNRQPVWQEQDISKSNLLDRSNLDQPNANHQPDALHSRPSLRKFPQNKIKEIARSQSSKATSAQVPKSEHRTDPQNGLSQIANVTQKFSFFKPKLDAADLQNTMLQDQTDPGQAAIRALAQNMKKFSRTQAPLQQLAPSASALMKTKAIGASFTDSEKFKDIAVESTNQSSSKEAALRRDQAVSLKIKNYPRKVSVDMGRAFKK